MRASATASACRCLAMVAIPILNAHAAAATVATDGGLDSTGTVIKPEPETTSDTDKSAWGASFWAPQDSNHLPTAYGCHEEVCPVVGVAAIPVVEVREMETISKRAPIPSSAVAVCSSETLAKANRELGVSGTPSLSRMP